jgi:hypothetical protein
VDRDAHEAWEKSTVVLKVLEDYIGCISGHPLLGVEFRTFLSALATEYDDSKPEYSSFSRLIL